MKKLMLVFAFGVAVLWSCKSNSIDNPENLQLLNIPACVQAKIDSIKNIPVWNPPASVYSYTHTNKHWRVDSRQEYFLWSQSSLAHRQEY